MDLLTAIEVILLAVALIAALTNLPIGGPRVAIALVIVVVLVHLLVGAR